ncbi:MAG: hypothetical protein E7319_10640 [Clostridiales bacterium]|nr:hypothetical protein [Clostridiales bacterium]
MNTEPKKTNTASTTPLGEVLKNTPNRFWKRLTHNWGWKLLSLLLAVCLWAGLIAQDPTMTRERRFTDVGITVTGEDTLRRNGLIVLSGLEKENLHLSSFRAEVPQRSYNTVSVSNFNPRIDLARITETGEQDVRVTFSSSSTYGTVESASPDQFHIVVDEYVTNYRVPVTLNLTGEYPQGLYGSSPIVEPSTVAVSGPKTIVDQVATILIDFDRSSLYERAGLTRVAVPIRYVDAQGNEISSDLLEASNANAVLRTVTIEQRLYASKTLDVSTLAVTSGTPAAGYEVKSVTTVPATLLAAGENSVLEDLSYLFTDVPIDVQGKSESFSAPLHLRKPAELTYLSDTSPVAYVEIGPIIETRTFEDVKVNINNVPEGMRAKTSQKTATIEVTGPLLTVNALRSSKLIAFVDASSLVPGSHILPIHIVLESENADQLQLRALPATLTVTLE